MFFAVLCALVAPVAFLASVPSSAAAVAPYGRQRPAIHVRGPPGLADQLPSTGPDFVPARPHTLEVSGPLLAMMATTLCTVDGSCLACITVDAALRYPVDPLVVPCVEVEEDCPDHRALAARFFASANISCSLGPEPGSPAIVLVPEGPRPWWTWLVVAICGFLGLLTGAYAMKKAYACLRPRLAGCCGVPAESGEDTGPGMTGALALDLLTVVEPPPTYSQLDLPTPLTPEPSDPRPRVAPRLRRQAPAVPRGPFARVHAGILAAATPGGREFHSPLVGLMAGSLPLAASPLGALDSDDAASI